LRHSVYDTFSNFDTIAECDRQINRQKIAFYISLLNAVAMEGRIIRRKHCNN